MPWTAIAYISSGITLAAFVVATVAWVIRSQSLEREISIRAAIENKQTDLIERTLEFFNVDTRDFTKGQKFDLAITQIQARAKRFLITMIVVVIIAFLGAGVSVFAIWRATEPGNPTNANREIQGGPVYPVPPANTVANTSPGNIPGVTPTPETKASPSSTKPSPVKPIPAAAPNLPPLPATFDKSIKYVTCNGEWATLDAIKESGSYDWLKYSASWDGTQFVHIKADNFQRTTDIRINYLTWDGTCWQARWDDTGKLFVHTDLRSGSSRLDSVLNYLSWDGSKWRTELRENDSQHFFVAQPVPLG